MHSQKALVLNTVDKVEGDLHKLRVELSVLWDWVAYLQEMY